MTLFWILAAGMVAVALLFVLPPLLAPPATGRRDGPPQAQAALAVLREQLAQLQADHACGRIAPDHYALACAGLVDGRSTYCSGWAASSGSTWRR